jgi:hypothetical protein
MTPVFRLCAGTMRLVPFRRGQGRSQRSGFGEGHGPRVHMSSGVKSRKVAFSKMRPPLPPQLSRGNPFYRIMYLSFPDKSGNKTFMPCVDIYTISIVRQMIDHSRGERQKAIMETTNQRIIPDRYISDSPMEGMLARYSGSFIHFLLHFPSRLRFSSSRS